MRARYDTLLRNLSTLIFAGVLLIGVPIALIALVGWPLPTNLPSVDQIQLALRSGIDPSLLINTLAIIVWIAWAQLTAAIVAESVAAARGKTARSLPVLPGFQPVAAQIVAAVTLVVATFGPIRPPPATAAPLAPTFAEPVSQTLVLQPDPQEPPPPASQTPTRPDTATLPTYEVKHFDTFWSVADTTLGDGRRWQEIRDLNIGRSDAAGEPITPVTEHVTPGTTLTLPADATIPTAPATAPPAASRTTTDSPSQRDHVVARGDNLWSIAEATLVDAWGRQPTSAEIVPYWQELIETNRDRLTPLYDPNLIYPDQNLSLPSEPTDQHPVESSNEERPSAASNEMVVERGDNLWSIAETALTDAWGRQPTSAEVASYWQGVIETNRDRLQAPDDPNFIYPWQTLEIPQTPPDPTLTTADDPTIPEVDVDTTDTPASTAGEAPFGTATAPPADQEATPPPSPVTPQDDPTPIHTPDPQEAAAADETNGEIPLDIPDAYAPPPESAQSSVPPPAVATTPSAPPTTGPEPPAVHSEDPGASTAEAADDDEEEEQPDSGMLPAAAALAGLGIISAGLVALINRLRRRQFQQRQPGTAPTPPPPTATTVEDRLRAAAAPDATELIDLALRAMAADRTTTHGAPPELAGVYLEPDHLRILFWASHRDAPPGWEVDDDGRSWTLPTTIDLTPLHFLADTTPAPYPAIVTVGHGDGTQLLMNLDFIGALHVTGDPADVWATCYTMATELAASPFADTLQLVCVGFGHDLAHLERITVVDDPSDLDDIVNQQHGATTEDGAPSQGSPWALSRAEPPATLVVIDPHPTAPEAARRLLAACTGGHGISAVVGYPTGDEWKLEVSDGTVRIDPLGYTLQRRNLTPDERSGIAELINAAKDLDGVPEPNHSNDPDPDPTDTPSDPTPERSETRATVPAADDDVTQYAEPDPALEVKVLGTLRVDGLHNRFPQAKCAEVVAYLALHRRGTESDTVMEALWPEQPPNRKRLNLVVTRARATLGTDPDGDPYFPLLARGGLYRIGDQLGTDLERFNRHVQAANNATATDAQQHLRAALTLVEGPPFSGTGTDYGWAHTEGLITHAIVAVDDAAHRLANLALDAEDPALAMWAARQGILAIGVCEECYRNLMRCAIAQNNQTALDATLEELKAVLDADEGPDAINYLEEETIELYETHRRSRRSRAEG